MEDRTAQAGIEKTGIYSQVSPARVESNTPKVTGVGREKTATTERFYFSFVISKSKLSC